MQRTFTLGAGVILVVAMSGCASRPGIRTGARSEEPVATKPSPKIVAYTGEAADLEARRFHAQGPGQWRVSAKGNVMIAVEVKNEDRLDDTTAYRWYRFVPQSENVDRVRALPQKLAGNFDIRLQPSERIIHVEHDGHELATFIQTKTVADAPTGMIATGEVATYDFSGDVLAMVMAYMQHEYNDFEPQITQK
jgi:hypothetical protein